MPPFPRAAAIGVRGIVHEAPIPHRKWPEARWEAGSLEECSGAFDNLANRPLAERVALVSVRRGLVVAKSQVLARPDELGSVVGVHPLGNGITEVLLSAPYASSA